MKRRWCRKHLAAAPELNITAFMNLMVVLVPFLLITAVFSRITILELNVPKAASSAQTPDENVPMDLEVTVRRGSIEVSDRQGGLLKAFPATTDGSDLAAVSGLLQQVKARFPDKTDITLLLETDVPYERLVEVMDTVRVATVEQNGTRAQAELFPVISIGDAPIGALQTAQRVSQ
jgi:biopolymer transport protein ExbD